jgi:uncharacterized protein YciI
VTVFQSSGDRDHGAFQGKRLPRQTTLCRVHNANQRHGPVIKKIREHLAFQESLEAQGIMFAAGPQWTDDEAFWEGDGMVVIRTKSLAEAREIAAKDLMHASGARKFTVRPWLVNEGTITIKLNYAKVSFGVS